MQAVQQGEGRRVGEGGGERAAGGGLAPEEARTQGLLKLEFDEARGNYKVMLKKE